MRASAIIVLLAVTLAATGCGGTAKDRSAYVKALNKAQTGLAQRFQALQSRITPTSTPRQDGRTLLGYEAAVRDTVRDLRAVTPPSGFDSLHRRFIAQVADYGTALRSARAGLRSADPRAILASQGRLRAAIAQAGERLNATIRAINSKIKG
jgi:hypothetical protein